jgi:hypothetical protein
VDKLRAGLEAEGFRYHRLPLAIAGRRRSWRFRPINPDETQPAHKVKRLTADERRALRRGGLTDEQIDAVSMVGAALTRSMSSCSVASVHVVGLGSTHRCYREEVTSTVAIFNGSG